MMFEKFSPLAMVPFNILILMNSDGYNPKPKRCSFDEWRVAESNHTWALPLKPPPIGRGGYPAIQDDRKNFRSKT